MKKYTFLNLKGKQFEKKDKNENIEMNKKISNLIRKAQERAKLGKCYCCGKENVQICNSHSVPKFILKNIESSGKLLTPNTILNIIFDKSEKGINEAGIFKVICRECDSKIFQEYEKIENWVENLNSKLLGQIAMKNYLKNISKRLVEIELYKGIEEKIGKNDFIDMKKINSKLDLDEYKEDFRKAKRIVDKNWENEYYIIFYKKLEYKVPVAFQESILLVCDIEGNIINNIHNLDEKYKLEDIHICIYPLKNESIILVFVTNKNMRYKSFIKQFKKKTDEEKLEILNCIMFMYAEDIFFSKKVEKIICDNNEIIELSKKTSDILAIEEMTFNEHKNALMNQYDLNISKKVLNLLSRDYAINDSDFKLNI